MSSIFLCISDQSHSLAMSLCSELFNNTIKAIKIIVKEYVDEMNYIEVMVARVTDPF